jgi:hypothetical protein
MIMYKYQPSFQKSPIGKNYMATFWFMKRIQGGKEVYMTSISFDFEGEWLSSDHRVR